MYKSKKFFSIALILSIVFNLFTPILGVYNAAYAVNSSFLRENNIEVNNKGKDVTSEFIDMNDLKMVYYDHDDFKELEQGNTNDNKTKLYINDKNGEHKAGEIEIKDYEYNFISTDRITNDSNVVEGKESTFYGLGLLLTFKKEFELNNQYEIEIKNDVFSLDLEPPADGEEKHISTEIETSISSIFKEDESRIDIKDGVNLINITGKDKVGFLQEISPGTINDKHVKVNFKVRNVTPASEPVVDEVLEGTNIINGTVKKSDNDERDNFEGDKIIVTVNETEYEAFVDDSNKWTIETDTPLKLTDKIEIKVVNPESDNESEVKSVEVKYDENLHKPEITEAKEGEKVVKGEGTPGDDIIITDEEGKKLGEGTVVEDGTFEIDTNRPLKAGETIKATPDTNGNKGTPAEKEVEEDEDSEEEEEKDKPTVNIGDKEYEVTEKKDGSLTLENKTDKEDTHEVEKPEDDEKHKVEINEKEYELEKDEEGNWTAKEVEEDEDSEEEEEKDKPTVNIGDKEYEVTENEDGSLILENKTDKEDTHEVEKPEDDEKHKVEINEKEYELEKDEEGNWTAKEVKEDEDTEKDTEDDKPSTGGGGGGGYIRPDKDDKKDKDKDKDKEDSKDKPEEKDHTIVVEDVKEGDKEITGKGNPGDEVIVINEAGKEIGKGKVDRDGNFTIKVDTKLKEKNKLEVIPVIDGKEGKGTKVEVLESGKVTIKRRDHIAYIQGYKDGTVRPMAEISRQEVAAALYRLLPESQRDSHYTLNHNFTDIKGDQWSRKHIATLASLGIVEGYNGEFRPYDNITRAELVAMMTRFDNLGKRVDSENPVLNSSFTDVKGHWGEKDINSAAKKGWIQGYEDGTFKPNQDITRAEFVTIVNNVLNRRIKKSDIPTNIRRFTDLEEGKWYYEAMVEASNSHYYQREVDGYETWTQIYDGRVDW